VSTITLRQGDCLEYLRTLESGSADCVITDPPYPEIDRPYGRWTEAEWWELIVEGMIPEVRRVLKPTGSAVFILQPNSRKVGSMRGWLWEFMAWACREWNIVQDAYWWNPSAMPVGGATRNDLMRPSVKPCVWMGPPDCYRDQSAILLSESDHNRRVRILERHEAWESPSRRRSPTEGLRDDHRRMRTAPQRRGGSTPFNLIPAGTDARWNGGTHGHPASTPMAVAANWTRYICPPGGVVLDPFMGSGTMGLAAVKTGRSFVGCERMPEYFEIARKRIEAEQAKTALFEINGRWLA
jgi:hypothetical protein